MFLITFFCPAHKITYFYWNINISCCFVKKNRPVGKLALFQSSCFIFKILNISLEKCVFCQHGPPWLRTFVVRRCLKTSTFSNKIIIFLLDTHRVSRFQFLIVFWKCCPGGHQGDIFAAKAIFRFRVWTLEHENRALTNGFWYVLKNLSKNAQVSHYFLARHFRPGICNVWRVFDFEDFRHMLAKSKSLKNDSKMYEKWTCGMKMSIFPMF